ncbi:ArfGap-domain-containing protein [Gigaspora margarita]|uniref:ArfGap-domain-containing protein n=1 Tax=Gigaspora margarita TaxID=4874 RepID=A0A8H3X064_GIGMA|nr:ArfGap-domain-containing protein [Gigaspora margarita]
MTSPLNLHLCQEDPPYFRKELADCEASVFGLEITIKNFVKLARASAELAQEYTAKQLQFAEELGVFARQQPDSIIKSVLIKYASSLQEVERSRRILNSHMHDMFIEPLESFAKNEILPLKDVKKGFDKASNEADFALSKYMNKRPRDSTIADASSEVSDTRKEFHYRYLDYVIKINQLEAKKKFEFMEYILALMFTESSFYHQSYETLKDLEPHMKDVTRLLHEARTEYNNDINESQQLKRSILESAQEAYNPLHSFKAGTKYRTHQDVDATIVKKSGYLFMKGNQRVIPSWTRKYFTISKELLNYCSKAGKVSKEDDESASINLRVCHVKPVSNSDRRFCFEVISPMRTYVLQAENQADMEDWIHCLQIAAEEALYANQPKSDSQISQDIQTNDIYSNKVNNGSSQNIQQSILRIKQLPGNECCVDCKSKDPQWASTNFGTLLCIECSGIHRSLGVHVSKVRSLMLDKWEPESIEVMSKLGNLKANQIFEAKLVGDDEKKLMNSSWERVDKEKFIIDKYVNKEFVVQKDENSIDLTFWKAMGDTNLQEALRCLSLGANVDWKNEQENCTTALHQAILRSDDVAVEFLLSWSCDIDEVDKNGWSCLHHAAATNNARLLLILMKRHANINLKDIDGKRPVDIAVELQKVQAVTVLRLYQFENQLTRSEYSNFGVGEALTSISKPYYTADTLCTESLYTEPEPEYIYLPNNSCDEP